MGFKNTLVSLYYQAIIRTTMVKYFLNGNNFYLFYRSKEKYKSVKMSISYNQNISALGVRIPKYSSNFCWVPRVPIIECAFSL